MFDEEILRLFSTLEKKSDSFSDINRHWKWKRSKIKHSQINESGKTNVKNSETTPT